MSHKKPCGMLQNGVSHRCPGALVNFTLPGLRFHTLQTRVFFSLAPSDPCTLPSSPVPRPFLARSSPGLARPSPGPHFKQSSRQNGQKRNLLRRVSHHLGECEPPLKGVARCGYHNDCMIATSPDMGPLIRFFFKWQL